MSSIGINTINDIEFAIMQKPYCASKVLVSSLNGDIEKVVDFFEIASIEQVLLSDVKQRLNEGQKPGFSIEMDGEQDDFLKTLAICKIEQDLFLLWLTHHRKTDDTFGVDEHCFLAVMLTVTNIIARSQRVIDDIAIIGAVEEGFVKFTFFDEDLEQVVASAPLDRFQKVSDLREGEKVLVRTWHDGWDVKVDFLPCPSIDKTDLRVVLSSLNMITMSQNKPKQITKATLPKSPEDWSNKNEVKSFVSELDLLFNEFENRRK